MSERMSEERLAQIRRVEQYHSFKEFGELLADIDALRAELTAARTVADGEVAGYTIRVHTIANHALDPGPARTDLHHAADLLTRLSAAKAEAERERDSARADALEEAARVFDAIPDETEISPEHWQEDPDTGFRVKVGRTTKRAALRPSFIAARIRALIAQGEQ